jgi:hypothetical protein
MTSGVGDLLFLPEKSMFLFWRTGCYIDNLDQVVYFPKQSGDAHPEGRRVRPGEASSHRRIARMGVGFMSFTLRRSIFATAPTIREQACLQLAAIFRESALVYGSYVDLLGAALYRNPCSSR